MAETHENEHARLELKVAEATARMRKRLSLGIQRAAEELKVGVQRNISIPTRASGPSAPGEMPHADTGRLRNSIFWRMAGELTAVVGTNLCVFGSSTQVVTDSGPKRIAKVRPGDKVLTQTGEYKTVLATPRYRAKDKPALVEIVVAWRRGKDHVLHVTADHKILVCRDGLNKWIAAGELTTEDRVFVRRKLVHNSGHSTHRTPCIRCGKVNETIQLNRKYCSVECRRLDWKERDANPHSGVKRTDATRAKQSARTKQRLLERPETHPSRILAKLGRMTSCEQAVFEWLLDRGREVVPQKQFGTVLADFYVPSERTVYEADGAYWHQDQAKDIERDKAILAADPGVQILHVHFFHKKWSPKNLEPAPLPGVHYVKCNPGTDSFCDPREFATTPIKSVRAWTYGPKSHANDPLAARLYDLVVEGVHSFVASGVVISNSYGIWLEYGVAGEKTIVAAPGKVFHWIDKATGEHVFVKSFTYRGLRPRPFLRPTLHQMTPRLRAIIAGASGGQATLE
jgi:hypothetical protein